MRMSVRVILVTGTPGVGKTSISRLLVSWLDAFYVNLTDLAIDEKLVLGKDVERNSVIVDEKRMKERIREIIQGCHKKNIIIDGHYAVHVVPKKLVSRVFVLRRDPVELRRVMKQCGFSDPKIRENLASEILDVCLVDALNVCGEDKTCELDVSGKTVKENAYEVLAVLDGSKKCLAGFVDWMRKLESEGLLSEYLRE